MQKRSKEYFINRMTPIGRFIYLTKTARFWHDGDTSSFYLNWWNPLAWIFCLIFVPLQIITYGLAETRWYDLGIGVSPYWKTHKREYF
jgi:hypothetical protein